MTENQNITLGIPLYNSTRFLPKLFSSIESLSIKPARIILLDDCSPDNPSVLVNDFISNNKSIRIDSIKNIKNEGIGKSYNRLIRECSTEWLHILDADDYFVNDFYALLGNDLYEKSAGAIMTKMETSSLILNMIIAPLIAIFPRIVPSFIQVLGSVTSRSGVVYRLSSMPSFNEYTYDGSDIVHLDLIRRKHKLIFSKKSTFHYRIHGQSATNSIDRIKYRAYLQSLKGRQYYFYALDYIVRKYCFSFIRKISK